LREITLSVEAMPMFLKFDDLALLERGDFLFCESEFRQTS
jgi:hypothetical protein